MGDATSPADSALNVLVFLGSVREHRMSTRVLKYIERHLEARGHTVIVLDPRELKLTEVVQPLHAYPDPTESPAILQKINKNISDADGFIVLTPEYNSCIAPALTALMDHFPPTSYSYRPSAIVSYSMGQFGGIRAAMQMRTFLSDLSTVHVPNMITIPKVHEALTEDGELSETGQNLAKTTEATLGQFEWYANALKEARKLGDGPGRAF